MTNAAMIISVQVFVWEKDLKFGGKIFFLYYQLSRLLLQLKKKIFCAGQCFIFHQVSKKEKKKTEL